MLSEIYLQISDKILGLPDESGRSNDSQLLKFVA